VLIALSWATYWQPVTYRRSGPAWSRTLSLAERRCRTLHQRTVSLRISPVAPGTGMRWVRLPCNDVE
jgi:hypothetical protein